MKLYHKERIVNARQLLSRLRRNALRHTNGYVQYLTLTGLTGILSSGRLHLSSSRRLNDLGETLNENMYEASFAFGESENIAMWCLYGVPNKEAVRVVYPFESIKEWVADVKDKKNLDVYSFSSRSGVYRRIEEKIKRVIFTDVAYGSPKLAKHGYDLFRITDKDESSAMTLAGVLKDYAWSYENEVRLIIEFEHELRTDSGRAIDIIAVDFKAPIEALQEGRGKLTLGPWTTWKCHKGKRLVAGKHMEFNESSLRGLIKCRCNDSMVAKHQAKVLKRRRSQNGKVS